MTLEDQPGSSGAELMQIVLHQRTQIEALQTVLAKLEARVAELEARRGPSVGAGSRPPPTVDDQRGEAAMLALRREREQTTRDALRHLDDVAYLAKSRLASLSASVYGQWPDGHTLQSALARAIHAMKPAEVQSHRTREHRRYHILYLTYMERRKAAEIAQMLAMSERQYYRDLKAAIQTVADRVLGPRS
jgi:hypothetical protein